MQLRDAGKMVTMYGPMMDSPSTPEQKKVYQNLCFSTDMLPEIKDWKVGETYKLVIEVKMTEDSLEEDGKTQTEEGDFDVLSVANYETPADRATTLARDKLGIR